MQTSAQDPGSHNSEIRKPSRLEGLAPDQTEPSAARQGASVTLVQPSAQDPQVLHFLADLPLTIAHADDIRGKSVYKADGHLIGHVHELVISHDGARVVYLEVENRTLLGVKKYLVPVEDVMVNAQGELAVKGDRNCTDATPWNCPELHSTEAEMTAGD
ncbi:MAG TPA: PRC-barrel domain-containing protein [Capsulimonadaceae bacterium]|jgi:sporulation protein YlmC with PRC-barrel domain